MQNDHLEVRVATFYGPQGILDSSNYVYSGEDLRLNV